MSTQKMGEGRATQPVGGNGVPMADWAQKGILEADHPTPSVQTRSRKKLPAWIGDAIKQAETPASSDKLPVVVLHEEVE